MLLVVKIVGFLERVRLSDSSRNTTGFLFNSILCSPSKIYLLSCRFQRYVMNAMTHTISNKQASETTDTTTVRKINLSDTVSCTTPIVGCMVSMVPCSVLLHGPNTFKNCIGIYGSI